jgi:hypothetical protein
MKKMLFLAMALAFAAAAQTTTSTVTQTTAPMTLWVTTGGSDGYECVQPDKACGTIQGALNKVPAGLNHRVAINVGPGSFTKAFGIVTGHTCGNGNIAGNLTGGIDATGFMGPASLDGGTTTGTFTNVTNTVTGNGQTWTILEDTTQNWYPSAMADAGVFIKLTGTTNGASMSAIIDNTPTQLFIPGHFQIQSAPVIGGAYQLLESQTRISGAVAATAVPYIAGPLSSAGDLVAQTRKAQVVAYGNQCKNAWPGQPDGLLRIKNMIFTGGNDNTVNWLIADEGSPVELRESVITQGAATVLIPTGSTQTVSLRRNHIDTSGQLSFPLQTGTKHFITLDSNDIQKMSVVQIDEGYSFISRTNRWAAGISGTGTFRANSCKECQFAGDRFYGSAEWLLGSFNSPDASHTAGFSKLSLDSVSVAIGNNPSGLGMIEVSNGIVLIDHGASTTTGFTSTASTFNVAASRRFLDIQQNSMVSWKHGTTSVIFAAPELTKSITFIHNLGAGMKWSELEASNTGVMRGPQNSYAGWSADGTTDPGFYLTPMMARCRFGSTLDPLSKSYCNVATESASITANGSGVATLTFNVPAYQIAPVCTCSDTNAAALVQIPSSTTLAGTCTALGGAAGSGHIVNINCVGTITQ